MKVRKKKKVKTPNGYDSTLEHTLHNNELKGWEYHPKERIEYVIPSSYEPDFKGEACLDEDCSHTSSRRCKKRKTILVEVKGRFRTRQEASKYLHIRESLKDNEELIFIFQDANKPMPFAKKRNDDSKQTHGDWASKNNFKFECLKKGLGEWLEITT